MGTPPAEFILSPAGFDSGPTGALTVRSLVIKLNFTTPDPAKDAVILRGKVQIAEGFAAAGQPVAVSVGGVVRRFVLSSRGSASGVGASFRLSVKKRRGHVAAQQASFVAIFTRGSLREQLDDEGLTGAATIPKPGVPHLVTVMVLVGGGSFRNDVSVNYTALAAKSGSAVAP
jgi:hypothetical protein